MALIIKDRVQETSTTSGTGTLTLAGAVTGYQSFASAIGNGNTTYYGIYEAQTTNWEVGIGTVGSGTLARTTVLASSNAGSLVNFGGGQLAVWGDMPAAKGAYFDLNGNLSTNCLFEGFTSQAASSTAVTLTASSVQNWTITGSGGQTIQLPDATTLPNGALFTFNNNQSSGTIVVKNNSGTTVCTTQSGAYIQVILLSNSIAAGSWDYHNVAPSNASWSTNTLSWAGSYTNGTWNGNVITGAYGGTGINNGTNTLTLSGSYTLNQSVASGAAPSFVGTNFSSIPNGALTNSSITINGNVTALGGSVSVGTVTSVSGTAPVVSSGGSTPTISMAAANSTTNGYLTSTDWNTFNNKQAAFGSQTANTFFAAPNGSSGTPSFRAIVAADVPTLNQNTTGNAATATTATNLASGATNQIAYQTGSGATSFITAPTTASTYLSWNGTGFAWASVSGGLVNAVTGTAPISVTTTLGTANVSITQASGSSNGYLSSTDWNTFNGKAPAVTFTTNYVPYGQGTTSLNQSSAFTFDGTIATASVQKSSYGFFLNPTTIATSYTIPSGNNAVTAGKVTINTGVTVTVSTGSRWVVV